MKDPAKLEACILFVHTAYYYLLLLLTTYYLLQACILFMHTAHPLSPDALIGASASELRDWLGLPSSVAEVYLILPLYCPIVALLLPYILP